MRIRHAGSPLRQIVDARHQPRFNLEIEIIIYSRTCGVLKGTTVDISESGISAMLRLEFTLSLGLVTIYATLRQRNAFRYGFEFIELNAATEVIWSTCRRLAVEQHLMPPDNQ